MARSDCGVAPRKQCQNHAHALECAGFVPLLGTISVMPPNASEPATAIVSAKHNLHKDSDNTQFLIICFENLMTARQCVSEFVIQR